MNPPHSNACARTVLHGFPHSPFVAAAARALTVTGTPFDLHEVPPWDRSEVLRLTQGGSYEVPVLVHEGRVIHEIGDDSQEIARYIDREFAGCQLFPQRLQGIHELVIRYLEHEVESVTFRISDPLHLDRVADIAARGMLVRHKERKFGRGCVERWRENRGQLAQEALTLLEPLVQMLGRQEFLFAPQPVYADFLLAGLLDNLVVEDRPSVPELPSLLREFHTRIGLFRYQPPA